MSAPRYECVVTADLPRRAARAAILHRVRSPMAWLPVAVLVVLAVGFALAGLTLLAFALAVVVLVFGVSLAVRVPKLARQLAARGLRPGDVVAAEYGDDEFTVTTPVGSAVHAYTDVRRVAVTDGVALVRLRQAGFLVLLPDALVPGEARRLLAERAPGRRARP